ncbi:MAG: sulfatase, partial [Planctomycetota bacterium]
MNVLFLDFEDFSAASLGCYGNPICKSPNIDRLAANGVLFERAYVQAVCCNPSRSSFLSGLRPATTNVHGNSDPMPERLPPGTKTLPTYFKEQSFYLANIGKLFHGGFEGDHLRCYDRLEFSPRAKGWEGPGPILSFPEAKGKAKGAKEEKAPKKGDPGYEKWRRQRSDRYGDSGTTEEEQGDYRYSMTAVALLQEFARDKRHFFLSVGSQRPHTPLLAPKKYIDMYDPAKIPAPMAPPEKDQGVSDVARKFGRSSDIFMNAPATPEQAREAVAAYYACVSMVDAGIGRILDTLEKEGLADNTIVVFLGDHGFHLGEHGLWSKYTLFEQSRRAPLIVRVPGAPGNGTVCRQLVEFVDILPTLGELSGLDLPKNLEGKSFAPLLVNPKQPWKKAAFTEFTSGKNLNKAVVTDRYRYAEWPYKGELFVELYDLKDDPWETVNLADNPEYAKIRDEMAALLKADWKSVVPE